MDAFTSQTPLELARLRGARKSEAQDRLVRDLRAGDSQDAKGTSALLGFLGEDESSDPYTGDAAHARQGKYDAALDFFRPDVAAQRHEQQNFELSKAAVPGQTAIQVAQINAGAKQAQTQANQDRLGGRTVQIPDPRGTGGTYSVPVEYAADPEKAKAFIAQYQDNDIGSTRGQADRSKIDAFNTLIDVMGQAEQAGNAAKWQGVGPMSRVTAPLYHMFGVGSNPEEENLRNLIGRIQSREAFGEGGKQLSPTEWNLINQFVTSTSAPGEVINARLGSAYTHAADVLRNLGVPDQVIAQRIARARGQVQ